MDSEKSFKDQLMLDAENLVSGGITGMAISALATGANKALNHYTPQTYPIGELFADYVIDSNNLRKGPHFAAYTQSNPRVISEMGGKAKDLLIDLGAPMLARSDKIDFLPSDINELREMLFEEGKNNLGAEILGEVAPDKFSKVPGLLEKVRSGKFPEEVAKELPKLLEREYGVPFNSKAPATHIVSPRNNMPVLAHEFGHLFETLERSDAINSGPEPWRKFKKAWNFVHEDLGVTRLDQSELLPQSVRDGIESFKTKLNKSSWGFLGNTLIDSVLTNPMIIATTPIVSSKVVRDAIGGLDPTGNTQKVMDWVGDHNVAVAALAAAPGLIHEAATVAPGYKAIVDFWKEFNKGEAGALAGSELLKKSAPLIGKKKPWLEGLKFLGSSALTLLPNFAPAIGAMVGNWITKDSEDK